MKSTSSHGVSATVAASRSDLIRRHYEFRRSAQPQAGRRVGIPAMTPRARPLPQPQAESPPPPPHSGHTLGSAVALLALLIGRH